MATKFLAILLISAYTRAETLVSLPDGQVQGHELQTPNNTTFNAFQSIPFATPPTGSLRFQAPQPVEKWDGILDATKDSHDCYQVTTNSDSENEDCLYLNVYTPVLNPSTDETKLPVVIFIHGGSFRSGGIAYGGTAPDYLIEQGVVAVVINYRLGPFGFLATGDTIIPGNAGLKDQTLAIKWTYDNINYFGGDPDKITIFGQSAGAASVGYHILSPLSAGLFRGAIADSGTPLDGWALLENPASYAYTLAQAINSSITESASSSELLEFLQSLPARSIDNASSTLSLPLPVLEPEHDGAFITESMYDLLYSGKINKVPTLMGINSEEDLVAAKDLTGLAARAKLYDANIVNLVPKNLNAASDKKTEIGELIKNAYVGDQLFEDNLGATVRYMSDTNFIRGIIRHAEMQSNYTDLYFYQFSYDGVMGNLAVTLEGADKVGHGEEMKYIMIQRSSVYDNSKLENFPEQDVLVHERLVKLWTNFVKYLNPTPEASDLLQNVTWPTVSADNFQYLDIDTDLQVKTNPKEKYYSVWKSIYEKYGSNLITY